MKLASEIKNIDIYSLYEKEILGVVDNIILDPTSGSFVAITIKGKDVNKKTNMISSHDIKHLGNEVLVVESRETVTGKEDLPKAYEIKQDRIRILGNKVITKSGKKIGIVTNFALDTHLTKLSRIYVSKNRLISFLGGDLIFTYNKIIKIKKNKIVVKDYVDKVKEKTSSSVSI